MGDKTFKAPIYPECSRIRRHDPYVPISEELASTLASESVLPLFETKMYEHRCLKKSSLRTNELLKCRWKGYLRNLEKKKRPPFQFPSQSDYHYYNYFVRYKPSETITKRESVRYRMPDGPGFDQYGQIPIAEDMHLRKSSHGQFVYKNTCNKID